MRGSSNLSLIPNANYTDSKEAFDPGVKKASHLGFPYTGGGPEWVESGKLEIIHFLESHKLS